MGYGSGVRSAALLIVLTLPCVAAADVWDEAYGPGLNAIKAKDYALAVEELQRAVAAEPNEFLSDESPRNGWTAYLPHYWLGIAKFHLGDMDGALRAWAISEAQGVVTKSAHYAPQLQSWIARARLESAARRQPAPVQSAPVPVPATTTMEPRPTATMAPPIVTATMAPPVAVPVVTATTPPASFPADEQARWDANIAFHTPDEIQLDESHVIKLLLDLRLPATELERQLGGEKTATATIRISPTVEARLAGTAFEIRAITPELQAVSAEGTTEWQWEVMPRQEGRHRLFLTINAILGSGPAAPKRSIRTFDRVIEVRVPPRAVGGWLVPLSVLAGILVAVLSWLVFARRRRLRPAIDDTVPIRRTTLPAPTASSRDPVQFREGQVIGERYRVVRFLGQGGMGAVYAAEDGEFEGELVALKTILAPGADADHVLARFKKEIRLARRVAHPNVCRIFDVGYHGAGPMKTVFVSMQYVTGVTLKAAIEQKGRLRETESLAILRDVAAALDATHAAGLIHRDVKSANVMLTDGGRAVLMDFGLACLSDPGAGDLSLTRTGAIVGTPTYMAPEQIEGTPVTAATDIFAFGMLMYEMVTGRLPYEGDTPMIILAKRMGEPLRSPAHFVPNLRADWERAILRCLEHDPAKRFRKATDVIRALDRAEEAPTVTM